MAVEELEEEDPPVKHGEEGNEEGPFPVGHRRPPEGEAQGEGEAFLVRAEPEEVDVARGPEGGAGLVGAGRSPPPALPKRPTSSWERTRATPPQATWGSRPKKPMTAEKTPARRKKGTYLGLTVRPRTKATRNPATPGGRLAPRARKRSIRATVMAPAR